MVSVCGVRTESKLLLHSVDKSLLVKKNNFFVCNSSYLFRLFAKAIISLNHFKMQKNKIILYHISVQCGSEISNIKFLT